MPPVSWINGRLRRPRSDILIWNYSANWLVESDCQREQSSWVDEKLFWWNGMGGDHCTYLFNYSIAANHEDRQLDKYFVTEGNEAAAGVATLYCLMNHSASPAAPLIRNLPRISKISASSDSHLIEFFFGRIDRHSGRLFSSFGVNLQQWRLYVSFHCEREITTCILCSIFPLFSSLWQTCYGNKVANNANRYWNQ